MRPDDQSFSPNELERPLRAILALLIAEREEQRAATAPRTETILAQAGLTDADIGAITGADPTEVHAILDSDRSISVIDRARAHMTRNGTRGTTGRSGEPRVTR